MQGDGMVAADNRINVEPILQSLDLFPDAGSVDRIQNDYPVFVVDVRVHLVAADGFECAGLDMNPVVPHGYMHFLRLKGLSS